MSDKEYMRKYMLERYHRRRNEAISKLGGKCVDCGSSSELEFDHIESDTKSFSVAKAFAGMAESKLWEEIDKCVLRCKSCHTEKTNSVGDNPNRRVQHGGGLTGKRNCFCDLCKPLKQEYNKNRRKRMLGTT